MKVAYLASRYPTVSHTFIMREVLQLRAAGLDLATMSVRRPTADDALGAQAQAEARTTRWLVPPRLGEFFFAQLWTVLTRPVLSVRTIFFAVLKSGLTLRRRFVWLCYFGEAVLLARWLVDEGFDHIHCHFGNSGSSTGMLAARLARIPFSMTIHGSELLEMPKHRLPEKVAQAAFVSCVSKYGRSQLMMACPTEDWNKLHIVRCGVPVKSDMTAKRDNALRHVLCVARLSPEKGHLLLLEALAILRAEGVDFHCTFVGDGPLRGQIERRLSDLRLAEWVTLTGSVEPARVDEMYQSSHVVVLASFSEGVPIVLMEAMARGLAVVATRVGGVSELVEDGASCGLVVPPGDAEALAQALRTVLEDKELAFRLASNGQKRVREEFNLENSASQLASLFRSTRRRFALESPMVKKQTSASA
ncbi:MAG: glycosyltransferase family 4 protein [Planctomycetes bacterium]|nr:glycosyltransferase family 4 protein [Planctomycetota bacterium]